jgi:hypothetical protein
MTEKIFYFHIPKTGGKTVQSLLYLAIHSQGIYRNMDYYAHDYEKCLEISKEKQLPFIHSENLFPVENKYSRITSIHNNNICEEQCIEILKKIKKNGYTLLVTVRNPIDLRCSFFNFFWENLTLEEDKDKWCRLHPGIYKSSENISKWLDYSCETDFLISPNLIKEFDFIVDISAGGLEKIDLKKNVSENKEPLCIDKSIYNKLLNTKDFKYYNQYHEKFSEKIKPLHLLQFKPFK